MSFFVLGPGVCGFYPLTFFWGQNKKCARTRRHTVQKKNGLCISLNNNKIFILRPRRPWPTGAFTPGNQRPILL